MDFVPRRGGLRVKYFLWRLAPATAGLTMDAPVSLSIATWRIKAVDRSRLFQRCRDLS